MSTNPEYQTRSQQAYEYARWLPAEAQQEFIKRYIKYGQTGDAQTIYRYADLFPARPVHRALDEPLESDTVWVNREGLEKERRAKLNQQIESSNRALGKRYEYAYSPLPRFAA